MSVPPDSILRLLDELKANRKSRRTAWATLQRLRKLLEENGPVMTLHHSQTMMQSLFCMTAPLSCKKSPMLVAFRGVRALLQARPRPRAFCFFTFLAFSRGATGYYFARNPRRSYPSYHRERLAQESITLLPGFRQPERSLLSR